MTSRDDRLPAFFAGLRAYRSELKAGRNPGPNARRELREQYESLKLVLEQRGMPRCLLGMEHIPLIESALLDFDIACPSEIPLCLEEAIAHGEILLGLRAPVPSTDGRAYGVPLAPLVPPHPHDRWYRRILHVLRQRAPARDD